MKFIFLVLPFLLCASERAVCDPIVQFAPGDKFEIDFRLPGTPDALEDTLGIRFSNALGSSSQFSYTATLYNGSSTLGTYTPLAPANGLVANWSRNSRSDLTDWSSLYDGSIQGRIVFDVSAVSPLGGSVDLGDPTSIAFAPVLCSLTPVCAPPPPMYASITSYSVSGSSSGKTTDIVVNGRKLTGSADQWVRYIASRVVRQLPGTRSEQNQTAALSTWWTLKEGILGAPNPISFSSCSQLQQTGSYKDVRLKVTETCASGRPWQVGISGIQVPNVSDASVFSTLANSWPHMTINAVESEALAAAGISTSSKDGQAVLASIGDLQKSWLLRFPALGMLLQAPIVKRECVDGSKAWCYYDPKYYNWPEVKAFALDKSAAMQSIQDLVAAFNRLSP